jgi:hypothetical protein
MTRALIESEKRKEKEKKKKKRRQQQTTTAAATTTVWLYGCQQQESMCRVEWRMSFLKGVHK